MDKNRPFLVFLGFLLVFGQSGGVCLVREAFKVTKRCEAERVSLE
jgi:hypothetical protein